MNDEKGEPLTKLVAGETINVALQRLQRFGTGALEDKNGIALLDTDLITAEEAPYVFKPRRQPQQETLSATVKREAEEAVQRALAKRRRDEPPERILSYYVSKSHALSHGRMNGCITFGHNFFFDLIDPVTTTAFREAAPEFGKDEKKVHHPYFLREAAKLVNSAIAAGRPISQQLLWTNKTGHWLTLDDRNVVGVEPDFITTDVDMSRKNADGSQFYVGKEEDGSETPSKYDIVLTLEQKKVFVDADQIEAIDYAKRILLHTARSQHCLHGIVSLLRERENHSLDEGIIAGRWSLCNRSIAA